MINKTIKMAGMSAVMVASAGSFVALGVPTTALAATNNCNAQLVDTDFLGAYDNGSDTSAHIDYIGQLPMCDGVSQTFSLSAYVTEGSTWETSGKQVEVDFDTVTLNKDKTSADLKVTLPDGDCFYQTDLYANGLRYDGTQGALPHYPDSDTPDDLIDARSGGSEVCQGGGGGGGETPTPTSTPEVLGVTELPQTGGGLSGLVALTAGLAGGTVAYLRARRATR